MESSYDGEVIAFRINDAAARIFVIIRCWRPVKFIAGGYSGGLVCNEFITFPTMDLWLACLCNESRLPPLPVGVDSYVPVALFLFFIKHNRRQPIVGTHQPPHHL